MADLLRTAPKPQLSCLSDEVSSGTTIQQHPIPYPLGMVRAMPAADRIRDHAGQGAATTVAAHRTRRRLRADQARQLADLLRHQILTGACPDGTLPHETNLATDYRASRNTVRQALDLLRAEGLVDRLPSVGTVVVARKYPHGLDRLMGLAETLHEHGQVTNEVRTIVHPGRRSLPVHRRGASVGRGDGGCS
ncbi:regulatory GntR family protein [Streptomyces sp. Ag109_O5-1]|nr:regulatory GntR family protein [Streptomyces sp. Ag109_O5-1]